MTRDEINRLKTDVYKSVFTGCTEIDSQLVGSVICSLTQEEYWFRRGIVSSINGYLDSLLDEVKE